MPNDVHGIIQITNENVGVQHFEPFQNKNSPTCFSTKQLPHKALVKGQLYNNMLAGVKTEVVFNDYTYNLK